MSTPDKYDEQAERLLPCSNKVGCWPADDAPNFHSHGCAATYRPAVAAKLREQANAHCVDCCCARSWKALGITEYTGQGIPEHIIQLKQRIERLEAALKGLLGCWDEFRSQEMYGEVLSDGMTIADFQEWADRHSEARAALEGK